MSTKKKRKAKAAAHPKKTYRDVISNACSLLSLQGDQEAMDSVMESFGLTKKAPTEKP
jgi:hypothetical protein